LQKSSKKFLMFGIGLSLGDAAMTGLTKRRQAPGIFLVISMAWLVA